MTYSFGSTSTRRVVKYTIFTLKAFTSARWAEKSDGRLGRDSEQMQYETTVHPKAMLVSE